MINTKHTFTSTILPSITVTLRHLTIARRMQLDREQASVRQRRRDLYVKAAESEVDPGVAEGPKCEHCGHIKIAKPGDSPEVITRKVADQTFILEEVAEISREMAPAVLRAYVDRIEERDGDQVKEIPIEEFLSDAPFEVIDEISSVAERLTRISPEQSKNSQSPTTSEPPVGETQKAGTAEPASEKGST